ncbi:SRPBCC family protein [Asanoa sp. NPDC049573]|uniref:SRPBCC family protein n=1 Tax=Asanoa sp. NPDC049573 TaxID=3155396 RepID=UPI003416D686
MITRIEISRPPEAVFAYVADPARFPRWQPDIVSVETHPDGRFTTVRRIGGVNRAMTQEVALLDPPRRWSVRGVDGPVRPNVDLLVEPLDGGARSRLTFTFDYDGSAMGRALLPMVRRMTAVRAPRSVARLKELLEASSAG